MCCKWSLIMGLNFQFHPIAPIEGTIHPQRGWKNDLIQIPSWFDWCAISTRGRSDYNDAAIDWVRLNNTHFLALKDFKDVNAKLKGRLYFRHTLSRKLFATLSLIPCKKCPVLLILCIEYQLLDVHKVNYTHISYVFLS